MQKRGPLGGRKLKRGSLIGDPSIMFIQFTFFKPNAREESPQTYAATILCEQKKNSHVRIDTVQRADQAASEKTLKRVILQIALREQARLPHSSKQKLERVIHKIAFKEQARLPQNRPIKRRLKS